jgi:hypothetical protein
MAQVTVTRRVDAQPESVRAAIEEVEWFMRAAEFTDVTVEDGTIVIENRVGLATLTLTVDVVEDAAAALAYEQREGLFTEMTTRYVVEAAGEASEVTATTEFELGRGVVGSALDATLVSRQRRSELTSQLDALVERFAGDSE